MNKEVIAADLHLDVHIGGNNVYNVVIHKRSYCQSHLRQLLIMRIPLKDSWMPVSRYG